MTVKSCMTAQSGSQEYWLKTHSDIWSDAIASIVRFLHECKIECDIIEINEEATMRLSWNFMRTCAATDSGARLFGKAETSYYNLKRKSTDNVLSGGQPAFRSILYWRHHCPDDQNIAFLVKLSKRSILEFFKELWLKNRRCLHVWDICVLKADFIEEPSQSSSYSMRAYWSTHMTETWECWCITPHFWWFCKQHHVLWSSPTCIRASNKSRIIKNLTAGKGR